VDVISAHTAIMSVGAVAEPVHQHFSMRSGPELPGSQRTSGLASIRELMSADRGTPMSYVTDAELVEIVPDLRAMARVEAVAEVRAALTRLADRYAAMADGCQNPARVTMVRELVA
jgi:hypothetical protein